MRRIQRLTQEMGVNLAGVELILRLLDDMEEMKRDLERQMGDYVEDVERRLASMVPTNPSMPIRRDDTLLPAPNIRVRKIDL